MQYEELETEGTPSELEEGAVSRKSTVLASYLCQKLSEDIERELNEDPELKAACIEEIRTWITENEEFYGRTDDSFILRFLRVCKFDVEKTKKRILRHYQARHNYQKYFDRNEECEKMVEEKIKESMVYFMDYAGNCKQNIIVFDAAGFSPKKYSFDYFVCAGTALMAEIAFEDPRTQVNGTYILADYAKLNMEILMHSTPALIYRTINLMLLSAPIRLKGLHLINAPRIANPIIQFVKLFLTKKMRSRFFIHKDLDSLHKHISSEYLPLEYGGSAGPMQMYIDSTLQLFWNAKEVNSTNQLYGVNKHPQQSEDSDSSSS